MIWDRVAFVAKCVFWSLVVTDLVVVACAWLHRWGVL